MTWLINTTARPILTIGGEDFSDLLVTMTVNDQSINNTGMMLTGGQITLQENPGTHRLEDYAKTKFGRGTVVTLDLEIDGITRRHPRGHLLLLDSTYNPEQRTQDLQVGCILTLYNLTDNITNLKGFTPFELPEEAGFADIDSALQTEGKFLWQDNQGNILKREFFQGDGGGSNKAEAEWVSIRDYTALSSAPLGAGQVVPDTISVGYSFVWNESGGDGDTGDDGKYFDEDETISTYWLEHPAQLKKKQIVCQVLTNGKKECREIVVNDAKQTFSVQKTSLTRRNYGGPGGSVKTEWSITHGPAVELQGAYYAEHYAWEVARQGGNYSGIKLKGLETIVQNKTERTYEYGEGGEVVRTIEYQYQSMLSAMTQNDWRPGGAELTGGYDPFNPPTGGGRGFLTTPPKEEMYLQSKVTTTYEYLDNATITYTETLQSSAQCNGVGIFPSKGPRELQNIDATNNGTLTTEKRTSREGQLNPDQPPRNPGGTNRVTRNGVYIEESAKYKPTAAGSVTFSTQMPFNVPSDKEAQARERASKYAKTQRALIEGDAAGIRVAEAMRPEIFGYYPGMPFTYYDRQEQKVVKLRMNGTGWAINGSEALMSTDGCFIGLSNGSVNMGSNVPDPANPGLRSTPQQRAAAYLPPSVSGEDAIDLGRGDYDVMEVIGIDIPVALGSYTGMGDNGAGIVPNWDEPIESTILTNYQCYVSGEVVSAEAQLLEIDGIGTIPDYEDSVLEGPSGILIPDLFDPNRQDLPEKTYFVTVGPQVTNHTFRVTTFAAPATQTFMVETGAQPADFTFLVDVRRDYMVSVAESPFIVTVFAEPPDQVFDVRTSARPADRVFDVTVGAQLPESTPDGRTFNVVVGQTYEITTGFAEPDHTFLITTGQRPAPDPDHIFNLSVGGEDAPPVPDPNVIIDVKVSFPPPDAFFRVKVMEKLDVVTAEPPFIVTTSAIPANRVFEIETGAPAVRPENIFGVTVQAEGANRIFNVNVVKNQLVRVNIEPLYYSVQDGDQGQYRVSGHGLIYAVNPELRGYTGQNISFAIDCPANPFWISELNDNSGTPVDAAKATVLNQGITSGLVRAQFHEPGTYYYASESPNGPVGVLVIESPFAADPDQTFEIRLGAKAVDPDNVFDVTTSAEPADENHIVLVFAEEADQTFEATVIENVIINVVDQVFDVAALDDVIDVKVIDPLEVTVADSIQVAALDDLFNVEVSEP